MTKAMMYFEVLAVNVMNYMYEYIYMVCVSLNLTRA